MHNEALENMKKEEDQIYHKDENKAEVDSKDTELVKNKSEDSSSGDSEKKRKGRQKSEQINPIAESFEEAVERLSTINGELQSGKLPLEDALKKYEEAVGLRDYATDLLSKAKLRMVVAGEKKATAAFRIELDSLLSEFAEKIVEDFQERKRPSEDALKELWIKINGIAGGEK